MADAGDSKSPARKGISVRVRERAPPFTPVPPLRAAPRRLALALAPEERLRTLKGLAGYACGHTGSCCRAGWPIPIEPAPLSLLRQADVTGDLRGLGPSGWLDGSIIGRTAEGHCSFHETNAPGGGCHVETALGSEAMPFSCRQFPRLLLHDARGWHLSLSAWCGTAARLIVSGPALISSAGPSAANSDFLAINHIRADARVHVESLDALDAWPPLLKPGVLAGHDAFTRWEQRVLDDVLGPVNGGSGGVGPALASALCWTDGLRQWRPSDGAFFVTVGKPLGHRDAPWLHRWASAGRVDLDILLNSLMSLVPPPWRQSSWPEGLTDASMGGSPVARGTAEAALARYLGTRLHGSWVAYQGEGLRAVLASLVSAYGLAAIALRDNGDGVVTLGRLTSVDSCCGLAAAAPARPRPMGQLVQPVGARGGLGDPAGPGGGRLAGAGRTHMGLICKACNCASAPDNSCSTR